MGVQRRNVPHFKGLINAKVDPEAQGRDTTFTLCHAQLRKPILLLEMAKGVIFIFVNCMYLLLMYMKIPITWLHWLASDIVRPLA